MINTLETVRSNRKKPKA